MGPRGPGFRHGSCSWTRSQPCGALRSSSDAISPLAYVARFLSPPMPPLASFLLKRAPRSAQGGRSGVSRLCAPQWRLGLSYGHLFSRRACRSGLLSGVLGLVPFGSAGHTSVRPRAGDASAPDAAAVSGSGVDTPAEVGGSGTPRRAAADSPPARNAVPIDSAPGIGEPPTSRPHATSVARTPEPGPKDTEVAAAGATSPVLRFIPTEDNDVQAPALALAMHLIEDELEWQAEHLEDRTDYQLSRPASVGFLRM